MNAMQPMVVGLLVSGCALYAAWKLMPNAPRRALAAWMLRRLRLPGALVSVVQQAAAPDGGCGCSGCDAGTRHPSTAPGQPQPIRIHRRR
jgi:hypothetical protein